MKPLSYVLTFLATVALLPAAEGDAPPKKADEHSFDLLGNALQTITKEDAAALVAKGQQAMVDSNANPSRSVDAAVAFSKALKYYEQVGDTDTICDLEANIFWCKKRMNLTDIKTFLAQKSDDKYAEAALAVADAVVKKEVTVDQAGNYFARAQKFATRNPDKFDQISVRYFEVAERFVGTEIGIKAQKLSLAAQQSQMKQIKDAELAARATLFNRPVKITDGIQQAAVPSPDDQKSAINTLRSLYKADFAKRKTNQKKNFMDKLMEQVDSTKDDSVMLYVLLETAMDLAMDCNEFYTVIDASDRMAVAFKGVDAKAKKQEIFGKSRNANVRAILKLLDAPEDGEANSIVGKYFCFEVGKWDIGLPLLRHCSDDVMKELAEMENLRPSGVAQQVELGDKWYDLGKKGRNETKEGPYSRAQYWYQKAEPKITGISKERIIKRMDEIDSALPMTNLNYDNLTSKQWDRLRAAIVQVSATKDRNDIGLRLNPGKRYRIIPHPTDTWAPSDGYSNQNANVSYKGRGSDEEGAFFSSGNRNINEGALVVQIENGNWMKPGIIEGNGRVFLGPFSAYGWGAAGTGVIRCKIMPADDE